MPSNSPYPDMFSLNSAARLVVALAGVFSLAAPALRAQSAPTTQIVVARVTIPEIMGIAVDGSDVNFPIPSTGDIRQGFIETPSSTIIENVGNVRQRILIRSETPRMVNEDGTLSTKPASDLEWSVDDGQTWQPLRTDATAIAEARRGGHVTIRYRLKLRPGVDEVGSFLVRFSYTVVDS